MTKRFLIAMGMAVVLMVGCARETNKTVETAEEKQTVLAVYAGQGEEDNLRILAEAFEKQNPDIAVELCWIPDSEYTKHMMRIKNGEAEADCIFFPNAGEAAIWKNKRILKNLNAWFKGSKEAGYYRSWYWDMEEQDACYFIPYRIGKLCVYYNKALFNSMGVDFPQEGWTWEEFRNKARRLTGWAEHKKVYGILGMGGSGQWWMLPARTRGAANPFEEESLELFRESAVWCHDMFREFAENSPYPSEDMGGSDQYYMLFLEGRLGMLFDDDSGVNRIDREMKAHGQGFAYDVAELPVWDQKGKTEVYSTAVISMAEASRHPDEAYRFIEFCAGEKGARLLAESGTVPAWQSEEVQRQYLSAAPVPEHAGFFLADGVPTEYMAHALYNAGMEIMNQEVGLYLADEQELEYAFEKIARELLRLKTR